MCFIALAHQCHPRYALVVAANRDELRGRASEAAQWWDGGRIVAGRDGVGGGTWLGVAVDGRFGAVTNVRGSGATAGARSRGLLVLDYLQHEGDAQSYLQGVADTQLGYSGYAGFNLLIGEPDALYCVSSRTSKAPQQLEHGIHGFGNEPPDKPDARLAYGLPRFGAVIEDEEVRPEALFALLGERGAVTAPTEAPTEVHAPRPLFIAGGEYGTVSSTVLLAAHDGTVRFIERRWDARGHCNGEVRLRFKWEHDDAH